MDQTSSRMDSVLKKLEKVSHMTSSKSLHTQLFVLPRVIRNWILMIQYSALYRCLNKTCAAKSQLAQVTAFT